MSSFTVPAYDPSVSPSTGKVSSRVERNRRQISNIRRHQRLDTLADQIIDSSCLDSPANLRRRSRASKDLLYHAKTYHDSVFTDKWADYHIELGKVLQQTIMEGGWHAMAVPRGGGKTQLCQVAAEWALLHGHKRWVILLGATDSLAQSMLKSFLFRIRFNKKLREDFPEICSPFSDISAQNAKTRRSPSGKELGCKVGAEKIVFPCYPEEIEAERKKRKQKKYGHGATGSRISVFGLTGAFRGLSDATVDGDIVRPDLAICDDPQTRESARSFSQSKSRMEIITGDVAYLAAPNVKMSVVVPCTVIYKNDMAEQLLNREQNPEWHGQKYPFFCSMPSNMELWNKYYEIKSSLMRRDRPLDEANNFYLENREKMDAGASVTWEDRKGGAATAIQHGMDRYLANRSAFNAEFQNQPDSNQDNSIDLVDPQEIIKKQSHTERYVLPKYVEELVAHIDVQQESLWYVSMGASRDFECCIVDYGCFPRQDREYFTKKDILRTLSRRYPAEKKADVRMYLGIRELLEVLCNTELIREDGARMKYSQILVDCGYEQSLVVKACRESGYSNVTPSKGLSIRATQKQFADYSRKEGETLGHHWLSKPIRGDMVAMMDVNYWKCQVHQMLRAPAGAGSLRLWKDYVDKHRLFADHLNAEYCVRVTAGQTVVDEWSLNPNSPDNEHFDNVVGCFVALSMRGCRVPDIHEKTDSGKKRVVPVKVINQSQSRWRRKNENRERGEYYMG